MTSREFKTSSNDLTGFRLCQEGYECLAVVLDAEEGRQRQIGGHRCEVGGSGSCVVRAVFDDMLDGLGVGPASRETSSLARVDTGCVRADEDVTCDEAHESGGGVS